MFKHKIRALRSLDPNTAPYDILDRGVLGRQGAIYAENSLFWAAYDGIYSAANGSQTQELTSPIRIYIYQQQFAPDASVCLGYKDRKLWAFENAAYLRYDFVGRRWTSGTLSDNIFSTAMWQGLIEAAPPTTVPQLWLLTTGGKIGRIQYNVFRDMQYDGLTSTGTAPPAWVYRTGYFFGPQPTSVTGVELDITGVTNVDLYRTAYPDLPVNHRTLLAQPLNWQDETWYPGPADFASAKFAVSLSAANTVQCVRALWELRSIDRKA
jgi:hypothetical protein